MSRGAVAKLQEFFYQNIHLTTTLTGSERTTMSVRVTLDATGQVQALVERNARIESLTPEELSEVGGLGFIVNLRPNRL